MTRNTVTVNSVSDRLARVSDRVTRVSDRMTCLMTDEVRNGFTGVELF